MSSIRRLTSSRANAAHSTGPKTAAGKRRSSQNGLRHGCRSRTVILPNESPHDFDTLLQDHIAFFQPRNPVERAFVDQMASARWRQRRIATLENSKLNDAIAAQPPQIHHHDSYTRIRLAFLDLLDDSAFTILSRYETTESLRFYRALRNLLSLRKKAAAICTTEATLSSPYVSAAPQSPIRVHSCAFVAPWFSADKLGITRVVLGESPPTDMQLIATVAVPTLLADSSLEDCIAGLRTQTRQDFEIVVIDNSGRDLVKKRALDGIRIISMPGNAGFGSAINRAFEQSSTPFLITLNDDAVPCPAWLAALVGAAESDRRVGMCASQVRLSPDALDSAGMLIYGDGSSKQRGHGEPAASYANQEEVLLPSASAALYRRAMLDQIGLFDEHFFLYCEDTDLGLRARRAGWRCLYVPRAVVEHRYSHSAGRVSALKAYYVERNRIFVAMKNFPLRMLLELPLYGTRRYLEHLRAAFSGTGKSAQFRREGGGIATLVGIAVKAHFALLAAGFRIVRQRTAIRKNARLSAGEFSRLLGLYSTTAGEIARH